MRRLGLLRATSILLAQCGPKSQTGARVDAELEGLIPGDTVHLVGARMEAIRSSPLTALLLEQRQNASLEELTQRTGIDVRRDVDEMLVTNNGKQTLLLIKGKFKRGEVEKKLETNGFAVSNHNTRKLFVNGEYGVAFASDSVTVSGPSALVRAALDQGGKKPIPERLAALVRALPSNPHVWAVSLGRLPAMGFAEGSNFSNLERAFSAIDTALVSADLSRGLNLEIDAKYTGEAEAKQVHGALRGLIGLGRLTAPPDKPELLRVLDAFVIAQDGAKLRVKADLAADLLAKVVNQISPR
jgi:hypothetical protein